MSGNKSDVNESKVAKDLSNSATITSDEDLLAQFLDGDERSFVSLMRRYKEPIMSFTYRFLGDYDEATDIAQETFVRLYRFGHTFKGEVKFSTWLYTIAANLSRTELKKYRRRMGTSLQQEFGYDDEQAGYDVPDETYRPDERVDADKISAEVQKALMTVTPSYREMVVLRDIQHMSYEEICEITSTELGTVKSRINRGRTQLKKKLSGLYDELFGSEGAS